MASSASTVSFSEGPLFRQLLSFALPLMAVNILQYVYQAVDMAVVGQVVGDVGLVSMSNAVNAVFLVNAFVIGLSAGGGVVVARAVGAGDVGAQRRAYAATLLVALLAAAGIAVAGTLLARPAFTANAVPEAALDGAVAYTTVLCCGAVGPFLMNAAAAFLKAQGDAWTPLVLVGAATFVNVALDLVLVGPAGHVRAVLSVGLPSAVQMAVVNLSYALVTGMLNRYGVDVAAAAGVGLQISTIAGLPCWAIGQAITTAAAQCAGAGELARARDVARLGARLNIGVTLGIQVLIQLLAPAIVGLYGLTEGAPFDIAVLYLRITCSVNGLFYAAMYSFDSFALGAGSPRLVLANSLIDAFVVRFGLAFLLSGALGLGYAGIFVAQAASPVIPALIGGAYLRHWTRSHGVERGK